MARLLWTQRQDVGPPARRLHALAYDHGRERTVLFGGSNSSTQFADTWEWDGGFWTQVADFGPSARHSHTMAWDAQSGKVVLFGGASIPASPVPVLGGAVPLGDTWEWDGHGWTQLDDTGPVPRFATALSSDTQRHRLVLFGGATPLQRLGDTWEWDGQAWSQSESSGPAARSMHAMAYDEARGQTVLFGGVAADGAMSSSTWAWSGTDWTRVATMGPSGRRATGLAYGSEGVVMFSGSPGQGIKDVAVKADTWSWDGRFWTERQDIGPQPRHSHAMAFDSHRERFVMFGGETASAIVADTWELAERKE